MASNTSGVPTLDRLLAGGLIAELQRPEFAAVADCTRDGVRIGSLPPEMMTPCRHESRYAQKYRELQLAAHALVAAGLTRFDLSPGERPDFQLRHGSESVGLEVAELVEPESARTTNAIRNMDVTLREGLDSDHSLRSAVGDRAIAFSPWLTPKRSAERQLVAEFQDFIRLSSPVMLGNMVNDARMPTLRAHRTHVYIGHFTGGLVDVRAPGGSFNPSGLVRVAYKVLDRKRERAASYTGARLWLVMAVTDDAGVFDASVDVLGSMLPDIRPFEFVLVRSHRRLAIWTTNQRGVTAM